MTKKSTSEDFWRRVKTGKKDECWVWTGSTNSDGYGVCKFQGKAWKAHRLAWVLANGDIGKFEVCHRCDNPGCVNPSHLWLGTHLQNVRDCIEKGRKRVARGANHGFHRHPELIKSGERHWNSKLTWAQIEEIRVLAAARKGYKEIASRFGITPGNVGHIARKNAWVKK